MNANTALWRKGAEMKQFMLLRLTTPWGQGMGRAASASLVRQALISPMGGTIALTGLRVDRWSHADKASHFVSGAKECSAKVVLVVDDRDFLRVVCNEEEAKWVT